MWDFHICCLVLGFLLLATSLTHVQGAESIIYSSGGKEVFQNNLPSTVCELTLPDKTVCSYEYGSGTTPSPSEICEILSNLNNPDGFCQFVVNIASKSLSGIYTLKYNMTNSTVGVETYHVYLHTGSVPGNSVSVVENENMYLLLEDSFGSDIDRKCEVVYTNGTPEVVLDLPWESANRWGTEDECGFKIEGVSTSDRYFRRLRMSSSGAAYTFAVFTVTVIPLNTFDIGEEPPQEWVIGETKSISRPKYPYSKYCELWNPQKKMVQRESVCSYTQRFVTDADEGNWTFVFGIGGKILEDTIVQEIIVTKRDLQATVSDSERVSGGKSLLCSLNPVSVIDCSFTRPDGKVILPSEGIGNADYSYFGDGFAKGDCGLTIHNVSDEDNGMWKCTVSEYSTQTQRSGFMNVSTNVPDLNVDTHESKVFATTGSKLSLSCSAQAVLDYCWFRHPSGLPLRFSTDTVYENGNRPHYVYEDTLLQGVCAITILTARSEDTGEWTCNVGFLGSSNEDNSVPITVGISETDVISLVKEVVVSEDSAMLICYSVPLEVPLDYCHFIRPDGKGFNVVPQENDTTVLGRYRYEADGLEKGECGLRIVSGINEDEDLGKWACAARLQGRKNEGYDFITLKTDDVLTSRATVGSGGLSMRAIIGIVLGSLALLVV